MLPTLEDKSHSFDRKMAPLGDKVHLISPDTLKGVMSRQFGDYVLVDCRFPHEYAAGHVDGALNLWTHDGIMAHFFTSPAAPLARARNMAVIFHCEFSSHRAPSQYLHMRCSP